MQSPLYALLDAVGGSVEPEALASFQSEGSFAGAAEEAWRAAQRSPLLPDVLAVVLQTDVQGCVPDEQHVASCKQRGTAAFGRQQHRQAAALFSEALRYADESSASGAKLAARLYCNRALCLSRLEPPAWEAAAQDSGAAIACDPCFAKAYYRRACAARALGDIGSALEDARRAVCLLQEQGSQEAGEAAALVAELEAAAEGGQGGGASGPAGAVESEEEPSPDQPARCANGHASHSERAAASHGLHRLLAQAGEHLEVAAAEGAGRCLVAAEALPAGADVLREQPFAFALTKLGRRSACATCLAPLAGLPAPYFCPRCPVAQYCSAACRAASPFHSPGGTECGRPWPVLLPVEAVAALRLALRLAAAGEEGGAAAERANQVAALGTHFAEMAAGEAAELAALAALTHATWQRAVTEAGGGAGAAGAEVSSGDVLEALCRLQINGLAVVPAARRGSEDRLALALYPVGSLMNHSCLPNVSTRFEGGALVVRTIEPLPAGQPLLHCYGPQAGEMTAAQRQAMLRQHYFFLCGCRACAAACSGQERDLLADAAPAGLRCPAGRPAGGPHCEGAVLPAAEVPPGLLHRYPLPPGSGACCACGARLSPEDWQGRHLPDLQAAEEAHASAAAVLEQQRRQQAQGETEAAEGPRAAQQAAAAAAQQAIRALRQSLRLRQAHLHPHNLLLGATHDALAHAWLLAGNAQAASQHLRHSLAVLEHAYPPGSTAAAFQRRELARLLRLAAADAALSSSAAAVEQLLAEARQAEEAADGVLELHFGRGAGVAAG